MMKSSLAPRRHAPHSAELKRFSCGFRRVRQLPVFPRRPGARVAHLVWAGRGDRRISATIHENNKAHFARTVKTATMAPTKKHISVFTPALPDVFLFRSLIKQPLGLDWKSSLFRGTIFSKPHPAAQQRRIRQGLTAQKARRSG